jgi:hypothetical protein
MRGGSMRFRLFGTVAALQAPGNRSLTVAARQAPNEPRP